MDRFDDMQTFVRVVETGSFTGAAERLKRAKSAVSRRVTFPRFTHVGTLKTADAKQRITFFKTVWSRILPLTQTDHAPILLCNSHMEFDSRYA